MKKFLTVLLLLSIGIAFSGCKEKESNKTRGPILGQNSTMQVWTSQESNSIDALGKEFISASRIPRLKINVISFSSEELLQKTLLEKMAEGAGPDVIFTSGDWVHQNKNKLVPVKQTEGFSASKFSATFVRSAAEAMVQDGEIYGIPMAVDTLALIFNEDHMISRLLDRNSPGETWREFREDVELLTKENNSLERFSVSGAAIGRMDNLNYGFEILENIMLQMGTQFFTKDEGMASFASSVGVSPNGSRKNFGAEAVNFFTSFSNPQYKNYSWNGILANKNKEGRDFDAFIKGKTSIVFGFSRDLSRIKNMLSSQSSIMGKTISEKNIKVDFFPQMEDGKRLVIAKVLGFAVPKTARSPELSWSFLKFLAKKEMATSFHDATKLPTARLDLIVEQASDPELGFFVRQAKFAKNNFLPQPISKKELKSGLIFVVQEIINKKSLSSLSFLKNLENKMSKELEEYFSLEKLIKRPVQKQKKK